MIVHSGTAAFDLKPPARKEVSPPVTRAQAENWMDFPEPSEHEAANGNFYPNVAALETTAADWVYENGLLHPPLPPSTNPQWRSFQHYLANPYYVNSYATAATIPKLFISGNWSQGIAVEPPKPLPTTQREMPVIGYRAWQFKPVYKIGWGRQGSLCAINAAFGAWNASDNLAVCQGVGYSVAPHHEAPGEFCGCGFYVLSDLDQVESHQTISDDIVVGAVMGWGKVVQHGSEGWRAQHARIIALLDCQFSKKQLENTKAAARTYKLEVKTRPQLEAMVAEFGDPFQEQEEAGAS